MLRKFHDHTGGSVHGHTAIHGQQEGVVGFADLHVLVQLAVELVPRKVPGIAWASQNHVNTSISWEPFR